MNSFFRFCFACSLFLASCNKDQILTPANDIHFAETIEGKFNEDFSLSNSRSRTITPVICGNTYSGSTWFEGNSVSFLSGQDRIYLLSLSSRRRVDIELNNLTANLDLFVSKRVYNPITRSYEFGSTSASSRNAFNFPESISVDLAAGDYFIVVDGYREPGDFDLRLTCSSGQLTECEYYDWHEDRPIGISEWDDNYWYKAPKEYVIIEPNSIELPDIDGRVVRDPLDSRRFVLRFEEYCNPEYRLIRSLNHHVQTVGYWEAQFKIMVPSGKRGGFASEKRDVSGSPRGEKGFQVDLKNGSLDIEHLGNHMNISHAFSTDQYIPVSVIFDLDADLVVMKIEDLTFVMKASNRAESASPGIKSIWGIEYLACSRGTEYYIKEFCVNHWPTQEAPETLIPESAIWIQ